MNTVSIIIQELLVHEEIYLFFDNNQFKHWEINLENRFKMGRKRYELQIFFLSWDFKISVINLRP